MSSIIKELEQLVAANVISQATADRIQAYYQSKTSPPSNRFAAVLGVLGALLVGLGIVLVVAHNWDEFGRLSKTIFAFIPLVLGQGLCVYTLLKKKDNFTWRESSAVILFFGVAACIALISQIYHLGGSLADFLLTWMLLVVALVYIMPSHITGLLYIAGVTWYACVAGYFETPDTPPYLYFALLLLVLPAYLQLLRGRQESDLLHVYNWFIVASFACVSGTFAETLDDAFMISLAYIALFCLYCTIGTAEFYKGRRLYINPYLFAGVLGVLFMLSIWSFDMWFRSGDISLADIFRNSPITYMSFSLMLLLSFLLVRRYRAVGIEGLSPVEFSAFVFLVYLLLSRFAPILSILLINVWILIIALYYIRKGSQQQHLGILNLGLLIIAALAVFRFFDESIPFVWRGIFFLATGIGFFAANFIVIKKKRSFAAKHGV